MPLRRLLAILGGTTGGGGGVSNTISPVFNVLSDYSGNLQAAMDACMSAGGGIVYAGAGTYSTSNTTLELAYPVTVIGDGRGATVIDTGTANPAIRFKNPATAAQRNGCHIGGMTIHGTGSVGLAPKGLSTSVIEEIELYGYGTALVIDGSYSGTIGSWHNTIRDFNIHDVTNAIQLTGAGFPNGRANFNHIQNGRIVDFTGIGVDDDSGDNNIVERVDFAILTGSIASEVAIRMNDHDLHVWGCHFDPVNVSANVTNGDRLDARGNYHSGVNTAYDIDAGSGHTAGAQDYFQSITNFRWDDSTGQSNNMAGQPWIPVYFQYTDLAASLTNQAITPLSAPAGITSVPIGREYMVREIVARVSAAPSAGTITLVPTVGGSASSMSHVINSGSATTTRTYQGLGKDIQTYDVGVGLQVTTSGSLSPATIDLEAIVYVELT